MLAADGNRSKRIRKDGGRLDDGRLVDGVEVVRGEALSRRGRGLSPRFLAGHL